nr:hypothetical protein [Catenibacterium mitsuokai]
MIDFCFTLCILTCNFFSVSYTLTSHEYFNHIVYAEKELPDFYSIQIPHDIMNNDSTQILHTVENCLDKYQGNLFITKNKDNHYKKYVYLTHDKNQYLKSTPMFDHTFTFNIYTLDRLLSDGYQLEGEVHVTFPNEQSFNQFKNEMNAILHISIKDLNDSSGQVDYMIWIIICLAAFYFILVLVIIYDLLQNYKLFSIKRLEGYSLFSIGYDYICPIIQSQFLITFIGFFVLTLLVCRHINQSVIHFLIDHFLILFLFLSLTLIICVLMINRFKDVKAIDFLKNKGPSKTIIYFNQVVLFMMVLVILFLSSIGIETGYSLLSRMNNHNEWNTMKQYSILSEVSNVENSDLFTSQSFLNKQKELYQEFNSLGSLYADFNEYDKETYTNTSMAYVNTNYLKKQVIQDIHGHTIHISEDEKKRVVLAPQNYSKKKIYKMTQAMSDTPHGIKIIYYKSNQKFFTYNSLIVSDHSNSITNPVVQVLTNENGSPEDYDVILGYKYNPYKIKGSQERIHSILKKHDLDQYASKIITAYDEMSLLNHQEQTLFIAVIMISVALVSLMILMIYQNIHIFIQYHASLLAIETMEGYTPLSKYFYFVKSTVVLFISTFLISLLCHSYFIYTLIIHLILMTLWGMTYVLSIKKFERKNIIHLLKGTF